VAYLADLELPAGALEVAFVRSPYAHASFRGILGADFLGWPRSAPGRARYAGEAVALSWALTHA